MRARPADASGETLRERILALALHDGQSKGVMFERWLVDALPQMPQTEIARVWRWQDAPAPLRRRAFGKSLADLPDTGIDILAERHDGGLIAIQAKCLRPDKNLVLDDLKQFWLKVKGNRKLAANWVVTTGEWGRTVAAHASDAGSALINAQSEWGDILTADLGRSKPLQLDDNQKAAWQACVSRFRDKDRGKLVMACGTGKTLVSLRVAEKVAPAGGIVVYATPSIALTGQSRRSWLQNAKRPMRTMVVCSDEDEGAGGGAAFTGFVSEIEAPVSTDPAAIAATVRELQRSVDDVENGLVAIFATYQSLHRVCTAQEKHGLPDVDFVVADEAHRTAGKYDRQNPGPFQVVHHRLRAAKRLYQTATPRIYAKRSSVKLGRMLKSALEQGANVTIQDMNDQTIYGPQFHRLSFREALQAENPRLCDYRVIVLAEPLTTEADAIRPSEVRDADDVANTSRNTRVAALAQAMQFDTDDMEDIRSCIAFCNRVDFANQAAHLLGDRRLSKWAHGRALARGKAGEGTRPVEVASGSLSAKDNAKRRGDELQRLRDANGAKHITTNVNVLSEGIDVPALDAICFLDERKSEVEIVQAVGRVMRRPARGNKKHGYIVVPVVMSPQASLEESLATGGGDWSVVGQVLRALKAHDDRIETELTDILRVHAPSGGGGGPGGEQLDFWEKLANGDFDALAPMLAESGILGDQRAQTANLIKGAVAAAAHALAEETGMGRALAPVVGVADLKEDAELRACTQAALILMNACLVHERLVQTGNAIELPKLAELAGAGNVARKLAKAWRKILAHDYKPIFQPAVEVLKAADMGQKRTPQGVKYALYGLAEHAMDVAEKYAAAGMDHAGELFQAAMDNPQADGAYYTLTPGAMLLAELACDLYAPPDDPLWRKPSTWKKIAMMDPACGSGTLLVAFAAAVRRRAAEQGAKQKQLEKIHRAFVEQGMVGLDINRRAVQIAAAQLAMGGLGADFRNMGLWTLPRGRRGGWRDEQSKAQVDDVMLGSLELLFDNEDGSAASDFEKGMAESAKSNRDRHRLGVEVAADPLAEDSAMMQGLGKVAIALTNPPFSSLKNLAVDVEVDSRAALTDRMAKLRENVGARWPESRGAMSADSIRPPFSFILAERINKEHGAVGKIIPTTACTNSAPAGIAERRLLAQQFEIVSVVSLHDPKAYAWSVKGHQESLLLMRRTPPARRSNTVRFVSVRTRPTNADGATTLYERLREGDLGTLGRICEWPRERVEAGDWSPAVFYEPALAEACHELDQLPTKRGKFVRLGDLYEVNTTKQTVGQSKWMWCDEDAAEVPVAKSASESGQTRLQGRIDGWAKRVPRPNDSRRTRQRQLDMLTAKAGRLLVANTQDASSGRLSAIAFGAPVVGYAWTPVQNVSTTDAQALAVWSNSTVGRILLRKYGSRRANWPMYQPAAIKQLVVPNTAGEHWKRMAQPLLDAYRTTKDMTVPHYREPDAEVRHVWDMAVAKAAGLPRKTVDAWRKLLDAEPFVHGTIR